MRRVLIAVAALVGLWLIALVVLDVVFGARQAAQTAERLGESLQATATIGESDLALVRGRLELGKVALRRDDVIGHLALDVGDVRCELPPLGVALVDGECRELAVSGVRLDVSTAALFHIKNPKRAPVRARRVVIDDAVLAFSPSAFLPGLGRIAIAIDHAEAGPTVFRTPLSWLLALEQLRAHLELPAGITLQLDYHDGTLTATGTLFGSAPVALPVTLPIAAAAADARAEIQLLVDAGKDIAERLIAKRAEDWIRSKVR